MLQDTLECCQCAYTKEEPFWLEEADNVDILSMPRNILYFGSRKETYL